jgi:hypothetical protein
MEKIKGDALFCSEQIRSNEQLYTIRALFFLCNIYDGL